jgi:hypothetical protein
MKKDLNMHPFVGPKSACSISEIGAKSAIIEWMNRKHHEFCESTPGLKHAKGFFPSRTLCQKNYGTIKIKQETDETSDRIIQIGTGKQPNL